MVFEEELEQILLCDFNYTDHFASADNIWLVYKHVWFFASKNSTLFERKTTTVSLLSDAWFRDDSEGNNNQQVILEPFCKSDYWLRNIPSTPAMGYLEFSL